jgi:Lon protease-like protein
MLLPIFPLNIVLFPGGYLPLHIFEERYRLMMRHCLEGDRRFGVVLIKSGSDVGDPAEPEEIGTIAKIDEFERFDDGRMAIVVEGEQRFRIVEIVEQLPYARAEVEVLQEDVTPDVRNDLIDEVTRATKAHLKLLLGLQGEWMQSPKLPTDGLGLRYFIGSQLQGDVIGKQGILEDADTSRALELARRLLAEESAVLRELLNEKLKNSSGN